MIKEEEGIGGKKGEKQRERNRRGREIGGGEGK